MSRVFIAAVISSVTLASVAFAMPAQAVTQGAAFAQKKDEVVIPPNTKQTDYAYPPKAPHQNAKPTFPVDYAYPPKAPHQN
jgi:hypothetical protein